MYSFGAKSEERMQWLDPRLVAVLREVIKLMDITVLETHRGQFRQDALYEAEPPKTKVRFPHSKHNSLPSLAVDVAPYPIDWDDTERFAYLAGLIRGIGYTQGLRIRWGGDWDGDGEVLDNGFDDRPHFEVDE